MTDQARRLRRSHTTDNLSRARRHQQVPALQLQHSHHASLPMQWQQQQTSTMPASVGSESHFSTMQPQPQPQQQAPPPVPPLPSTTIEGRTLRHSVSAHPLLNRGESIWNTSSTNPPPPLPLSAGPRLEERMGLRPPLPDLGTCYAHSLDGQTAPPSSVVVAASTPPATLPLASTLPRSATPSRRPTLGSVHIPTATNMLNNHVPSPLDQPHAPDSMMNNHGQHLAGSPSWNSATHAQAEVAVDYRMDLTIDPGHHRVDSPLRRLAATPLGMVHRPHSASPHPPPTPTSAITIPMVYDPRLPVAPSQPPLSNSLPPSAVPVVQPPVPPSLHTRYLGMPAPAHPVAEVGHPLAQDVASSNIPSISAHPLALGQPRLSGIPLEDPLAEMGMMNQDSRQGLASSYRRSTYPLLPQQAQPPQQQSNPLEPSAADMMHPEGLGAGGMGAVGMGWQGVLLPIKAESPPVHTD